MTLEKICLNFATGELSRWKPYPSEKKIAREKNIEVKYVGFELEEELL